MADSHSSGDYGDVVSRRNFVALAGATGAAAIAGCLGDDDGGDDGDDGDSGDQSDGPDTGTEEDAFTGDADNWFTAVQQDVPASEYQWNPHVGWPPVPHDEYGMWARFGTYLVLEQEWEGYLFDEWDISDTEMVVTIRDDFTWGSNGEPVDAEDIAFHYDVEEAAGNPLFDFINGVEATGDFEVTFSYDEGTNTDIVQYAALYDAANHPPSVWEDLDWEESPAGVTVGFDDLDPSGPLAPTNYDEDNYAQSEPRSGLDNWEDHPIAEHFNWNGYRVEHRDGNPATHTSFNNLEIDGVHTVYADEDTVAEFPDEVTEIQIPGGFGMGLWFDHSSEPWDQQEVRQAVQYSINRQQITETVGGKIHHPVPTGLNWEQVEVWLGSEDPDGFQTYEYDTEMVDELLGETDVSQGDVTIEIGCPSGWSDWAQAVEIAVGHLNDAGWDAEWSDTGEPGTYSTPDGEDSPSVDLAAHQHTAGGPLSELPYFSYNDIFRQHSEDPEPWNHFTGYDATEDKDIDGDSLNPQELVQQLPETNDQSEREDIVRDLARIVNHDVPVIIVQEKFEQSFINEQDFATTGGDDPNWFAEWPMYWLPQVEEYINDATEEEGGTPGLMKARTE